MNVRSLTNPIVPVENLRTGEVRNVRTEVSSEDRDPDGRRQQDEPNKDPLTEEEVKKALEYLEKTTGLKANGLNVEIESGGEYKIFLIKDQSGKIVRRIIEWEMRALITDKDKKTGQIFDKSA
jgi:hypothetical protein